MSGPTEGMRNRRRPGQRLAIQVQDCNPQNIYHLRLLKGQKHIIFATVITQLSGVLQLCSEMLSPQQDRLGSHRCHVCAHWDLQRRLSVLQLPKQPQLFLR